MFGFILTRHVNSQKTNLLWLECVQQIRKFYPTSLIVIIDDSSLEDFVSKVHIRNCVLIRSEYPKRGELLPYYYLHKYKWFTKAFILHDSVFLQNRLPQLEPDENTRLWSFPAFYETFEREKHFLGLCKNNELLLENHATKNFKGMFGCMSAISLSFLEHLETKYNFLNLIHHVYDRNARMCLERVMGVLFSTENNDDAMFGSIFAYCKWGITFEDYKRKKAPPRPIVKVWNGR